MSGPDTALSQCEPLIDARAAASLLGICAKTVTRMAIRKQLPAVKIGKYWRFRASLLDEWIRNRVQSTDSPCPAREEQQ